MNARQAAKKAAARIVELEDYNMRCSADIKAYNQCIDGMIAGKSPCPWCMEYEECQNEGKDGKGCEQWWLKDIDFTGGDVDAGKGDGSGDGRVDIQANTGTYVAST